MAEDTGDLEMLDLEQRAPESTPLLDISSSSEQTRTQSSREETVETEAAVSALIFSYRNIYIYIYITIKR